MKKKADCRLQPLEGCGGGGAHMQHCCRLPTDECSWRGRVYTDRHTHTHHSVDGKSDRTFQTAANESKQCGSVYTAE